MVNRYAKARQMKRRRRTTRRLKNLPGRVTRDIERKLEHAPAAFREPPERAHRLLAQTRESLNKLFAWHAPEVEVIGKGKVARPREFGVKVSVAVNNRESVVVGCRSKPGNPDDGHTLAEAVEQAEILCSVRAARCYVDRGYRGAAIPGVEVLRAYSSQEERSSI